MARQFTFSLRIGETIGPFLCEVKIISWAVVYGVPQYIIVTAEIPEGAEMVFPPSPEEDDEAEE